METASGIRLQIGRLEAYLHQVYNVTISSGQTIEVGNSTTAVANNLTIDSGGSLTIAKNSDLTISGDFTNNGAVTLNSDADEFASIIVQGSSSGDIVYNRYVNTVGTAEWDLIGAPTRWFIN